MSDSEKKPNAQRPTPNAPGPAAPGPVLAVDFGERRIGLAISDPERTLALPLETIERQTDRRAVARIRDRARERGVGLIVIGEPRSPDDDAPAARRVARFAAKLGRATGLPCTLVDEALTSVEARRRLRDTDLDPREERAGVDRIAAQVILERFLDHGDDR